MRNSTRVTATRASILPVFEPHGYLHVAGDFVTAHRPEIEGMLRREAQRAHRSSPASHIIAMDTDGSCGLLVSTTTEHLAHRLGRALFRSFGGELHHGFGHRNQLAFVWWRC